MIYAESIFILVIIGAVTSAAGLGICMLEEGGYERISDMNNSLLQGFKAGEIRKMAGIPTRGEGLVMMGIALCCLAPMIGSLGFSVTMVVKREKPVTVTAIAFCLFILLVLAVFGLVPAVL